MCNLLRNSEVNLTWIINLNINIVIHIYKKKRPLDPDYF